MSSIYDLLNQCLLEDSWNLYGMYKDKEGLLILADNARTFEGGRQYREAAISAFVARQIATAGNREIWEISDFSHPVTIQWYDRLNDLWPDFFGARVQASQVGASSDDKTPSVVANAEGSRPTISPPADTFSKGTTSSERPDVPWESNPSAERFGMDTANEINDEQGDYQSDADEPTGTLEINTSSDWYQPQASNETSNRGRRRRARHSSFRPVPAHNPLQIQIHENEAHRIIGPGIVIAEGGPHHL